MRRATRELYTALYFFSVLRVFMLQACTDILIREKKVTTATDLRHQHPVASSERPSALRQFYMEEKEEEKERERESERGELKVAQLPPINAIYCNGN